MKGEHLAITRRKRGCHLLSDHFERKPTQGAGQVVAKTALSQSWRSGPSSTREHVKY